MQVQVRVQVRGPERVQAPERAQGQALGQVQVQVQVLERVLERVREPERVQAPAQVQAPVLVLVQEQVPARVPEQLPVLYRTRRCHRRMLKAQRRAKESRSRTAFALCTDVSWRGLSIPTKQLITQARWNRTTCYCYWFNRAHAMAVPTRS